MWIPKILLFSLCVAAIAGDKECFCNKRVDGYSLDAIQLDFLEYTTHNKFSDLLTKIAQRYNAVASRTKHGLRLPSLGLMGFGTSSRFVYKQRQVIGVPPKPETHKIFNTDPATNNALVFQDLRQFKRAYLIGGMKFYVYFYPTQQHNRLSWHTIWTTEEKLMDNSKMAAVDPKTGARQPTKLTVVPKKTGRASKAGRPFAQFGQKQSLPLVHSYTFSHYMAQQLEFDMCINFTIFINKLLRKYFRKMNVIDWKTGVPRRPLTYFLTDVQGNCEDVDKKYDLWVPSTVTKVGKEQLKGFVKRTNDIRPPPAGTIINDTFGLYKKYLLTMKAIRKPPVPVKMPKKLPGPYKVIGKGPTGLPPKAITPGLNKVPKKPKIDLATFKKNLRKPSLVPIQETDLMEESEEHQTPQFKEPEVKEPTYERRQPPRTGDMRNKEPSRVRGKSVAVTPSSDELVDIPQMDSKNRIPKVKENPTKKEPKKPETTVHPYTLEKPTTDPKVNNVPETRPNKPFFDPIQGKFGPTFDESGPVRPERSSLAKRPVFTPEQVRVIKKKMASKPPGSRAFTPDFKSLPKEEPKNVKPPTPKVNPDTPKTDSSPLEAYRPDHEDRDIKLRAKKTQKKFVHSPDFEKDPYGIVPSATEVRMPRFQPTQPEQKDALNDSQLSFGSTKPPVSKFVPKTGDVASLKDWTDRVAFVRPITPQPDLTPSIQNTDTPTFNTPNFEQIPDTHVSERSDVPSEGSRPKLPRLKRSPFSPRLQEMIRKGKLRLRKTPEGRIKVVVVTNELSTSQLSLGSPYDDSNGDMKPDSEPELNDSPGNVSGFVHKTPGGVEVLRPVVVVDRVDVNREKLTSFVKDLESDDIEDVPLAPVMLPENPIVHQEEGTYNPEETINDPGNMSILLTDAEVVRLDLPTKDPIVKSPIHNLVPELDEESDDKMETPSREIPEGEDDVNKQLNGRKKEPRQPRDFKKPPAVDKDAPEFLEGLSLSPVDLDGHSETSVFEPEVPEEPHERPKNEPNESNFLATSRLSRDGYTVPVLSSKGSESILGNTDGPRSRRTPIKVTEPVHNPWRPFPKTPKLGDNDSVMTPEDSLEVPRDPRSSKSTGKKTPVLSRFDDAFPIVKDPLELTPSNLPEPHTTIRKSHHRINSQDSSLTLDPNLSKPGHPVFVRTPQWSFIPMNFPHLNPLNDLSTSTQGSRKPEGLKPTFPGSDKFTDFVNPNFSRVKSDTSYLDRSEERSRAKQPEPKQDLTLSGAVATPTRSYINFLNYFFKNSDDASETGSWYSMVEPSRFNPPQPEEKELDAQLDQSIVITESEFGKVMYDADDEDADMIGMLIPTHPLDAYLSKDTLSKPSLKDGLSRLSEVESMSLDPNNIIPNNQWAEKSVQVPSNSLAHSKTSPQSLTGSNQGSKSPADSFSHPLTPGKVEVDDQPNPLLPYLTPMSAEQSLEDADPKNLKGAKKDAKWPMNPRKRDKDPSSSLSGLNLDSDTSKDVENPLVGKKKLREPQPFVPRPKDTQDKPEESLEVSGFGDVSSAQSRQEEKLMQSMRAEVKLQAKKYTRQAKEVNRVYQPKERTRLGGDISLDEFSSFSVSSVFVPDQDQQADLSNVLRDVDEENDTPPVTQEANEALEKQQLISQVFEELQMETLQKKAESESVLVSQLMSGQADASQQMESQDISMQKSGRIDWDKHKNSLTSGYTPEQSEDEEAVYEQNFVLPETWKKMNLRSQADVEQDLEAILKDRLVVVAVPPKTQLIFDSEKDTYLDLTKVTHPGCDLVPGHVERKSYLQKHPEYIRKIRFINNMMVSLERMLEEGIINDPHPRVKIFSDLSVQFSSDQLAEDAVLTTLYLNAYRLVRTRVSEMARKYFVYVKALLEYEADGKVLKVAIKNTEELTGLSEELLTECVRLHVDKFRTEHPSLSIDNFVEVK